MTNMTNEQQTPEDKVKEYIDRAEVLIKKNYNTQQIPNLLLIAQMLQREEHFNNNETFKEQISRINTLADNLSEATQILKLNNTKE